jgi:hypothetical protein
VGHWPVTDDKGERAGCATIRQARRTSGDLSQGGNLANGLRPGEADSPTDWEVASRRRTGQSVRNGLLQITAHHVRILGRRTLKGSGIIAMFTLRSRDRRPGPALGDELTRYPVAAGMRNAATARSLA